MVIDSTHVCSCAGNLRAVRACLCCVCLYDREDDRSTCCCCGFFSQTIIVFDIILFDFFDIRAKDLTRRVAAVEGNMAAVLKSNAAFAGQ